MEEIWKPIEGYEGRYEISNFRNVKSLGNTKTKKERILKPAKDSKGYLCVGLCKYNKQKTKRLHRLIAKAFIPNPENKPHINHINGIKTDNRIENLEWCTRSENQLHAYKLGLQKPFISEANKRASKETNQIISSWFNTKTKQEFTGNPYDLVKRFMTEELDQSALNKVRKGHSKYHKNWIILKE